MREKFAWLLITPEAAELLNVVLGAQNIGVFVTLSDSARN